MKKEDVRKEVRKAYGRIAVTEGSCCGSGSCCGADAQREISKRIGYGDDDISLVPEGANLGLGCGNPVALASLKRGDVVLDLGSGAGFDCFIASKKVGRTGKVIGVDMTPEMLEKARKNAVNGGYSNVEFRLGEIENLPVADDSVDVVISNCVINLSPEKGRVFNEIMRVLKPEGRFMVSDITLAEPLPKALKESVAAYIGCLAGAVSRDEYICYIKDAGFRNVEVVGESVFPLESFERGPVSGKILEEMGVPLEEVQNLGKSIVSIKVSGKK